MTTDASRGERRIRLLAIAAGVPILLILALAIFPWGLIARHAASPLSKALGRTVTIGGARRVDWFSYVPTIELRDVRIAQPVWAGGGDMADMKALQLRLPVLPLLLGRIRPRAIVADGVRVHLVRDINGRDNWSSPEADDGEGHGPQLTDLAIRSGVVRLDDAKRYITLDGTFSSDEHGLSIRGQGALRGAPLQLAISAPAIAAVDRNEPYPVRLSVHSRLASLDATLAMDHPLDTKHFSGRIDASGEDLGYLDDIIQAGLFQTKRFHLKGNVRRDGLDWHVPKLDATVGRSVLTAALDVTKPVGRSHLTGHVDARLLDFDDFSSVEQTARADAASKAIGARVVPDTRIVLAQLDFDGRIALHAARLLPAKSSPFRSLDGVATLDNHRLALTSIIVGLPHGHATGIATVDSRGQKPRLSLDLHVAGSTVDSFFPNQGIIVGRLRAHLRVAGTGDTVREALAAGDGKIGVAVTGGDVRRDYATFLGGNVFRSAGAALQGKQQRTGLDCMVANFALSHGHMVPRPLILSTSVARGDGAGMIILGPETIDLRVVGRPTKPGLLISTAPVRLFGTLSYPKIDIRPPRAENKNQVSVLARVGYFIKRLRVGGSDEAKAAVPISCPAEIKRALS